MGTRPWVRGARNLGEDDVVEVHPRHRASGGRALVGPGQEEQVLNQAGHALVLFEQIAGGCRPVGLLRVGQGHFQLGSNGGEGALELVGGIADKPTLALGRGLEPVQHVVHRASQTADLVGDAGFGHSPLQRVDRDVGYLGADRLDGSKRVPDDHPRRGSHDAQ